MPRWAAWPTGSPSCSAWTTWRKWSTTSSMVRGAGRDVLCPGRVLQPPECPLALSPAPGAGKRGDAGFCWRGWSSLPPLSPCQLLVQSQDFLNRCKVQEAAVQGSQDQRKSLQLYQALPGYINSAEEVVCIANAMLDYS